MYAFADDIVVVVEIKYELNDISGGWIWKKMVINQCNEEESIFCAISVVGCVV